MNLLIEGIVLFAILLSCILLKKENIILIFVILMPFHAFVKNCFSYFLDGGNMFAAWKEIAIIIFLVRLGKAGMLKISKDLILVICVYYVIIIFYFTVSDKFEDGVATLRDHIFPPLLLICISNCNLNSIFLKRLFNVILFTTFIVCLGGGLQLFVYKLPVGFLMGSIDFIDSSGYIQYKSVAFRIMDFERMGGLIGGPNDFGLYLALSIVIIFGYLFYKNGFTYKKRKYVIICIVLATSIICLLLSFSRAGWVIALGSIILMMRFYKIKINPLITFSAILGFFLLLILLTIFTPYVSDILVSTFSGKEASAADRGNNFFSALATVIEEPLGHGLGKAIQPENSIFVFYSESIFMNIGYEIGLFGLAWLIFFHIQILKAIRKLRNKYANPFVIISFALSTVTLIICLISVNPYGSPFLFFWWMVLGMGINKSVPLLIHYEPGNKL
jgi:hypothetical protein